MTNHIKPTIEELKANIQTALEQIDTPAPVTPQVETPVEPKTEPVETQTTDTTGTTDTVVTEPQTEEPDKQVEQPVVQPKVEPVTPKEEAPTAPVIDYKKKFVDSTREALIQHEKNAKIYETIEKANQLPEPTEEEMRAKYPQWDVMDDVTRDLAKDTYINKRKFDMLQEIYKESKDIETWNKTVDTFAGDPKSLIQYPELEGKVEEFKEFASRKSRRGSDMEVLVKSFLFDVEKAKPKNKGQMFPTGAGASKEKPVIKNDKISLEDARTIRETNFDKYRELLKAGKIQMDVE